MSKPGDTMHIDLETTSGHRISCLNDSYCYCAVKSQPDLGAYTLSLVPYPLFPLA